MGERLSIQALLVSLAAESREPKVGVKSSFLSSLAAALMLLAPVQAVAQEPTRNSGVQNRPRPDYDAQGRQIGGFTLNASLEVSGESNDNIFAGEDAFAESDMVVRISPELQLGSNWSNNALVFSAGGDITNHQDFSDEDTSTHYLGGYGRLDIGADTDLFANARTAHRVEPRTSPDASGLSQPVEYDRSEASVGVSHTLNRLRFAASAGMSDTDYDGAAQAFRDFSENYFTGRVAVAVSPRIAVLADARVDQREYDTQPLLDSDGRTLTVGLSLDITELVSGEFSVGQFTREYSTGDVEGAAFSGNIDWFITPLTTLSFSARRDVEETAATTAATYVNTSYGVRAYHELLRNFILSGGVGRVRREYEAIDREDEAMAIDFGGEYLVNRRVALRLRYERLDNDSTGVAADRDFEVNAVTGGVVLRL